MYTIGTLFAKKLAMIRASLPPRVWCLLEMFSASLVGFFGLAKKFNIGMF